MKLMNISISDTLVPVWQVIGTSNTKLQLNKLSFLNSEWKTKTANSYESMFLPPGPFHCCDIFPLPASPASVWPALANHRNGHRGPPCPAKQVVFHNQKKQGSRQSHSPFVVSSPSKTQKKNIPWTLPTNQHKKREMTIALLPAVRHLTGQSTIGEARLLGRQHFP